MIQRIGEIQRNYIKISNLGVEDKAQQLRALAVLSVGLYSIPSIHTTAHDS